MNYTITTVCNFVLFCCRPTHQCPDKCVQYYNLTNWLILVQSTTYVFNVSSSLWFRQLKASVKNNFPLNKNIEKCNYLNYLAEFSNAQNTPNKFIHMVLLTFPFPGVVVLSQELVRRREFVLFPDNSIVFSDGIFQGFLLFNNLFSEFVSPLIATCQNLNQHFVLV